MNHIQVACIGAAHRDIKSQALQDIVIRSSNPVRSESMWGGVARNICENLARFGIKTTMVSRVGKDGLGIALRSSLEHLGIGKEYLSLSATNFTASYTALLGQDGDMYIALADMEIYHELTPEILKPFIENLCQIPCWVVDLNLPKKTIKYLADHVPKDCMVLTMPVSVAKLDRVGPILPKTHTLILNRLELAQLSKVDLDKNFEGALNQVFSKGVLNLIITNGPGDVVLADHQGARLTLPVPKTPVSDTTGGGDALAAGYLYGLLKRESPESALRIGIEAARITVGTRLSVSNEISEEKVRKVCLPC